VRDIKSNKELTGYSHHILSRPTGHAYGTLKDTLKIVKLQRKGPHLNTLERLYIYKENKIGSLLNDTYEYTDQYNPLFELVTSVQEGEEKGQLGPGPDQEGDTVSSHEFMLTSRSTQSVLKPQLLKR
jgi:hypothetical protein